MSPTLTQDAANDPLDPLYAHVEDRDGSNDLGVGVESKVGVQDLPEPTTQEEKEKIEMFDPSR